MQFAVSISIAPYAMLFHAVFLGSSTTVTQSWIISLIGWRIHDRTTRRPSLEYFAVFLKDCRKVSTGMALEQCSEGTHIIALFPCSSCSEAGTRKYRPRSPLEYKDRKYDAEAGSY